MKTERLFLKNGCEIFVRSRVKYVSIEFDFWRYSKYELKNESGVKQKFFDLFHKVIDKTTDRVLRKRSYMSIATTNGGFTIPKAHLPWFMKELKRLLTDSANLNELTNEISTTASLIQRRQSLLKHWINAYLVFSG